MEKYEVNAFEGNPPPFELLAQENGFRFWSASNLASALGYADISLLRKAINKALSICTMLDINVAENILQLTQNGKLDYRLSRFACYLIVMNANIRNPMVARAQAFFAGLAESFWKAMHQDTEVDRLVVRGELSEREKSLAGVAKRGGVENYARFQDAGYIGLYNMPLWKLKIYKGFTGKEPMLDHMGRDELAANLFRLTQTEAKIRNERIRGQQSLEDAAETVGRIVRKTIEDISGQTPEDLPLVNPIAHTKRSIKSVQRGFKKLDKKANK
jgi:DNA-damage-inducible protein D